MDNVFSWSMTDESQLNEINQSFSERAQDFISCVFYIWKREKRSCCHASWYHSLAIDLSLFPSCAISGVRETPEMNSHSESPWLCCHSQNWSAGIEALRPETLGTAWILGWRQKLPWAGPLQMQFLALRIQAFYLTGSFWSLEHKYSSPESRSVYGYYLWWT